jgi:hypothetical protein
MQHLAEGIAERFGPLFKKTFFVISPLTKTCFSVILLEFVLGIV